MLNSKGFVVGHLNNLILGKKERIKQIPLFYPSIAPLKPPPTRRGFRVTST